MNPWLSTAETAESGVKLWALVKTSNFGKYLFTICIAVLVNMLLTITLAYPLTNKDLPGRRIYKALLLMLLVMGQGTVSEYIVIKSYGMVNTVFPQMILGFFAIMNLFVLSGIFNSKYGVLKEQASAEGRSELHSFFLLFIPKIWKPWIALAVLQFVTLWNSFYTSLIYVANVKNSPPPMLFRMAVVDGVKKLSMVTESPMIWQYGAVISLPCIILFLIMRKWLSSEVFISQTRKL